MSRAEDDARGTRVVDSPVFLAEHLPRRSRRKLIPAFSGSSGTWKPKGPRYLFVFGTRLWKSGSGAVASLSMALFAGERSMAKFEIRDIVWLMKESGGEFARVIAREGRRYRLFTSGRRQVSVDSKHIRNRKPTCLILESSLSPGREGLRRDRRRQSGVFLEEFFKSMGYAVLSERVHTVKSLEHFMKYARQEDVVAIHWNGHGYTWETGPGVNKPTGLSLSADELYLPLDAEAYLESCLDSGTYRRQSLTNSKRRIIEENLLQYELLRAIFGGLEGKVLMFSTCDVGKPRGLAEYVSKVSGAKTVITYNDFVADEEANVIEAVLYYRLLNFETKKRTPGRIVQEVQETMSQCLGRDVPLVCYVKSAKGV